MYDLNTAEGKIMFTQYFIELAEILKTPNEVFLQRSENLKKKKAGERNVSNKRRKH